MADRLPPGRKLPEEELKVSHGYRFLGVHLVPLVEGREELGPPDIAEVEDEHPRRIFRGAAQTHHHADGHAQPPGYLLPPAYLLRRRHGLCSQAIATRVFKNIIRGLII